VGVGFLGAGNFAQGFLLPQIQRAGNTSLVGVCTADGLNATNIARNFGFRFATTDPKEILGQESINTVFIATRHNLHASYVIEALKAGKHVFVEKPLALNAGELKAIQKAYKSVVEARQSPVLMVGFNRRFAPHAQHVKRFFENALEPYSLQYRVNAGFVPRTHWTRDPAEGGGRILGEICHFVDLMLYLTDSIPMRIYAETLSSVGGASTEDDSVAVTLKFRNGSVGTIMYLANGDTSLPKERVEISSTGRTAVIDNFQRLSLSQQGKMREFKLSNIDKGHRDEVRAFLQAIQSGAPSPIPFESLVTTTVATLKILESLQTGVPVAL
jgi:predicted dehydrogenase